jgi:hypothetical protein
VPLVCSESARACIIPRLTPPSDGVDCAHEQTCRPGLARRSHHISHRPSIHSPVHSPNYTHLNTAQASLLQRPFPRAAHGHPWASGRHYALLVRHTLPVLDNGFMRHIVIHQPSKREVAGMENFVYHGLSLARRMPYALTPSSSRLFI